MESPDVNILVHAFRKDSEQHVPCYRWLESKINGTSRFAISQAVLSGYLRIVTHPKVFAHPSSLKEAILFCESVFSSLASVVIEPGKDHWKIFCCLCEKIHPRGNQIPDVWLAALSIEHQCRWITLDKAFHLYPELEVGWPS